MAHVFIIVPALLFVGAINFSCTSKRPFAIISDNPNPAITKTLPPLGWNSYDCYGNAINDSLVRTNLSVFQNKLLPSGYEYFVIDAGWDGVNIGINLDEYGRSIPHNHFFPNGLQDLIKLAHDKNIKFGLWLARGINKKAVEQNLPIKGTKYHAQDIASKTDTSTWFPYNYGVDMTKPGAQEFYNSIMNLLASWEIDFVKYDDIVPHPDEIIAVSTAIKQCGRNIVLSLSPGDEFDPNQIAAYNCSNMVRITSDIWDNSASIQRGFEKWEIIQGMSNEQFCCDLDMIPFGSLMDLTNMPYLRHDNFSIEQKKTFITQRALATSPLIFGGALPETDSISFALVTNPEMLACDQNGEIGQLIFRDATIDIWKTPQPSQSNSGWFGVFNRSNASKTVTLKKDLLHLDKNSTYDFFDIWENSRTSFADSLEVKIPINGTFFCKYSPVN